MRVAGFTLVESVVVLAAVATLAAVAMPTMAHRLIVARRADATLALERVQVAQERHRALHGLYTDNAAALGVSLRSPEGLYDLSLSVGPADTYAVVARPTTGSPQEQDDECTEISLTVNRGFATPGPARRCWSH